MGIVMCEEIQNLTFVERLADGGATVLMGMGIVFSALAILWGVLVLFKLAFYDLPQKKAKKVEVKTEVEQKIDEVLAEENTVDDGAIVAAITVAIGEMLKSEGYNGGFRVVSFKRSGKNTAWNKQ